MADRVMMIIILSAVVVIMESVPEVGDDGNDSNGYIDSILTLVLIGVIIIIIVVLISIVILISIIIINYHNTAAMYFHFPPRSRNSE